jgi:hypothetical protein
MPESNVDVILRVLNGRRFQSEMYGAGRAVRQMGSELQGAGKASSGLSAATGAAAAGLYGIGQASHAAAYGAAALAAAWVTTGIKFNATMEGNTLAFEHFTGSVKQSQKFTKQLFEFARSTPFSFEDITAAARRFLAFGFNVKETTGLLKTMGDTMSLTGGSTDDIMRFAKALGDIRSKGRLMQQEMNQLTNLNIPIREILEKGGLELTEKQLKNVGKAGIDADTAIGAIQTGLNKMYGGGAQKYLNTFNGQWQRLTDNLKMAAGDSTKNAGIFDYLKKQIVSINQIVEGKKSLPEWVNTTIGLLKTLWKVGGVVFGGLSGFGKDLMANLAPAKPFLDNVILPIAQGLLFGVVGGLETSIGILGLFANILGFIGQLAKPFRFAFVAIGAVLGFVFGGEILDAIAALGKFGGVFRLIGAIAGTLLVPIRLVGGAFERLSGLIFRVLNPKAISRLVYDIVNEFNRLAPEFLRVGETLANKFVAGLATMVEKVGSAIFRGLVAGFIWGLNKAIGIFNKAIDIYNKIPLAPNIDHVQSIKGLDQGGTITSGGLALVGESGPEIAKFPVGTTVHNPRMAKADLGFNGDGPSFDGGWVIQNKQPIMIDRRQIGEAIGEYVAQKEARR